MAFREVGAKSRTLGGLYTYYKRLASDGYGQLYSGAMRASGRMEKATSARRQVTFLTSMAKAEFGKEKKLLERMFGVPLDFDFYKADESIENCGIRQVIEALNYSLSLKDVYERNKLLIQHSDGQKAIFSFFPDYFVKALNSKLGEISGAVGSGFGSGLTATDALKAALMPQLGGICQDAITMMFTDAKVESALLKAETGLSEQEIHTLQQAYAPLIQGGATFFGDVHDSNSLLGQLYRIYNVDKIAEILIDDFRNTGHLKEVIKDTPVDKVVHANFYANSGLSLEAIRTGMFSMVASMSKTGGASIHAGDKGTKADNICTLNINPSFVEQALKNSGKTRDQNIAAFNALGEKVRNIKDGYIIYSNAKNYTLNSGFGSRGGFSGGRAGLGESASSLINSIYGGGAQGNSLLGAIYQLGSGAILEGQNEHYENYLATDIAYMLFDDFSTIGTADMDGNAIHIMDLNGILFPMSALLFLMADAFSGSSTFDIKDLVKVRISVPAILFGTAEAQSSWQRANDASAIEAWNYQAADTAAKTKVQVNFLANFAELVRALL